MMTLEKLSDKLTLKSVKDSVTHGIYYLSVNANKLS